MSLAERVLHTRWKPLFIDATTGLFLNSARIAAKLWHRVAASPPLAAGYRRGSRSTPVGTAPWASADGSSPSDRAGHRSTCGPGRRGRGWRGHPRTCPFSRATVQRRRGSGQMCRARRRRGVRRTKLCEAPTGARSMPSHDQSSWEPKLMTAGSPNAQYASCVILIDPKRGASCSSLEEQLVSCLWTIVSADGRQARSGPPVGSRCHGYT